ncbi:3-methyl-2-oxobutanoate hydroxymethyltransferase [Streptomyces sp. NPDC050546]|uniref:3-methyl-2-oxobutanoate hydroxymethyltransferase n=1 Tax=Streptomyces sp. NPDC050546 TaxID=3365628 RepID=UPI0037AE2D34
MVLIEMVPGEAGAEITRSISIPTVCIGAGNGYDAQVPVWQDMAGLRTMAARSAYEASKKSDDSLASQQVVSISPAKPCESLPNMRIAAGLPWCV